MFTQVETDETQDASADTVRLERVWIAMGAIFGLLAVIAGAAGTHALRGTIEPDALNTFETAVRFQTYHALALLAVGLLAGRWRSKLLNLAGGLFVAGVALFSGSLYTLALTDIGAFGAIAPLGGLSLMAGWASLAVAALLGLGIRNWEW
jgi:uncharacterized membrane protein YgdD (TMEM256/DUF423 family)